eukprot:1786837-Rhodomonas_salina.1
MRRATLVDSEGYLGDDVEVDALSAADAAHPERSLPPPPPHPTSCPGSARNKLEEGGNWIWEN